MLLVLLLYLFSYKLTVVEPATLGIINGTNADIADYPWMVSIFHSYFTFCGGSLISPEWVLTAGHCAQDIDNKAKIRAGSSNFLDNNGTVVEIADVIFHPNYTEKRDGSPFNDLSLLRLKNKLNGTNIATINLPEAYAPIPGDSITITGWGDTTGKDDLPYDLQVVTIPIPTLDSCVEAYQKLEYVVDPKGEFCAGSFGESKGTCHGDSGGPAEINGTIFGMVSWGKDGCSTSGVPVVLVNIPNYRNWIRDVTGI